MSRRELPPVLRKIDFGQHSVAVQKAYQALESAHDPVAVGLAKQLLLGALKEDKTAQDRAAREIVNRAWKQIAKERGVPEGPSL